MKPNRPTETDLLAVVQNGFQDQLRLDREPPKAQENPAPAKVKEEQPPPPAPGPHVRITLAIPEDLRYRIKLAVMDQRRKAHPRLTQDEFCAEVLRLHLENQEQETGAAEALCKARDFLLDGLQARGFKRPLAKEAAILLDRIGKALGQVP